MLGHTFDDNRYIGKDIAEDLVVEVECTLKELYNGCSKEVEY